MRVHHWAYELVCSIFEKAGRVPPPPLAEFDDIMVECEEREG